MREYVTWTLISGGVGVADKYVISENIGDLLCQSFILKSELKSAEKGKYIRKSTWHQITKVWNLLLA